jgi:lipopolysaccharide transport system ATP-binding protein
LAVFYYEFELTEDIGIPICGVLITNERGVIVHGKNAWQYDNDVPLGLGAGSRVVCRQEITLQLGPGEYTFELGLAAVTQSDWERRRLISHDEWASRYLTVCVVTNAGQLSVGLAIKNGIPVLTHHGVADLPGRILTRVLK